MNLRNKLMLMALLLIVALMSVSTAVAYLIINRQSLEAAGELIGHSFALIEDDIKAGQAKLANGASQLATAEKMPVNVKYIEEYKAKTKEPEIRPTYAEMIEAMRSILRAGDIYQAAVYGAGGELIAYAQAQADGVQLGYIHPFPALSHHGKTLKAGQELGIDAWEAGGQPPQALPIKYEGVMPAQASGGFALVGGFPSIRNEVTAAIDRVLLTDEDPAAVLDAAAEAADQPKLLLKEHVEVGLCGNAGG